MPCIWRQLTVGQVFRHFHWTRTPNQALAVNLRPYQEACLNACTDALDAGVSRMGVSLPTGSGKTTVFISLLDRIDPPRSNPTARKSLIIVNSIELALQTATQANRLFPDWSVEIEQGARHCASGLADVYALLSAF
jgi:ATP-dependent helicase IRC3